MVEDPLSASDFHCWICYGGPTEQSPYSRPGAPLNWRRPCQCNLVAHEECLLSWIAEKNTSSGVAPDPRDVLGLGNNHLIDGGNLYRHLLVSDESCLCPQCQMPIRIEHPRSMIPYIRRQIFRWGWKATKWTLITTTAGSAMSFIYSSLYFLGAATMSCVLPPAQALVALGAPISSDGTIIIENLTLKRFILIPAIPVLLVLSRSNSFTAEWMLLAAASAVSNPFKAEPLWSPESGVYSLLVARVLHRYIRSYAFWGLRRFLLTDPDLEYLHRATNTTVQPPPRPDENININNPNGDDEIPAPNGGMDDGANLEIQPEPQARNEDGFVIVIDEEEGTGLSINNKNIMSEVMGPIMLPFSSAIIGTCIARLFPKIDRIGVFNRNILACFLVVAMNDAWRWLYVYSLVKSKRKRSILNYKP